MSEFATNISASESPAGPEAADPEIAAAGLADEVTTWATAGLAAAEAEDADQADAEFAWGSGATAPAPEVSPDPASAWSAGVIEDLPDDQDTWSPEPVNETPYFARLTASTADWEAAEVAPDGLDSAAHDADAWDPVEPETPVEAVASVDAVGESRSLKSPGGSSPSRKSSDAGQPLPPSMRSRKSPSLTSHGGNSPPPRKSPRFRRGHPPPMRSREPAKARPEAPRGPLPPSMRSWKSRN
ncbi:MAG: hypothetical protein IPI85_08185 [Dehalococcoidia bacterium]|nr:hypothetical protein [Dehalococcoidia bacterium]